MARKLLPREHGAYAEVLLPLAAVLIAGEIGRAAILLTVAVLCAFLAHEPLSVLLGRRGERARADDGRRALRWIVGLVAAAVAGTAAALVDADPTLRVAVIAPLGFALWSGLLLRAGQERTTSGEIVIATTLASTAIPVGVAAGLSVATSVAVAVVWAVGAALATATVRGIILAAKLTRSWQP